MDFREYQELAHSTSLNTEINGDKLVYPILGLANEAGEVAGKLKKLFRDKNGVVDDEFKKMISSELGDVLWYLSETAIQLDIDLSTIATINIDKLFKRKEEGKIKGSGDNR